MRKQENTEENDDVGGDDFMSDEEQSASSFKTIKNEKEKLKKCFAEKQEYLDGWQRARADYANLIKKMAEDRTQLTNVGSALVIGDLIPVLDSFEMAFAHKEAWESVDASWRSGIEYIHTQFVNALERYQLATIEPKEGDTYAVEMHEASENIATSDKKLFGKIAKCRQRGYMLQGTLLRPARVSVYEQGPIE